VCGGTKEVAGSPRMKKLKMGGVGNIKTFKFLIFLLDQRLFLFPSFNLHSHNLHLTLSSSHVTLASI
jgi:hypothetical protein